MGITEVKGNQPKPFTEMCVKDRDLVIKMLKYEEQLTKSQEGQDLYRNRLNNPFVSLTVEKILNRMVLSHFGFDTTDENVEMYRTIFRMYFQSPFNYDAEVIGSVHYMRENKCVFYRLPPLQIGDIIPDCDLYELNGVTKTTLHQSIAKTNGCDSTVFAAFSMS
jgi:hypothetical protein